MNKILVLGDIHGIDTWKKVVEKEDFDVCVFVGDYFDSFDIDTDTQISNFKEILAFKEKSDKKVILLLGNHDLHYLYGKEKYSGFQNLRAKDIEEVLLKAYSLDRDVRLAYEEDGFLFTHAGVTKTWVKKWKVDEEDIEHSINFLPLSAFLFSKDEPYDPYGDAKHQGPMWVRPKSLKKDAIDIYAQVVGHTRMEQINQKGGLYFIDSLWNGNYITIEQGSVKLKTI